TAGRRRGHRPTADRCSSTGAPTRACPPRTRSPGGTCRTARSASWRAPAAPARSTSDTRRANGPTSPRPTGRGATLTTESAAPGPGTVPDRSVAASRRTQRKAPTMSRFTRPAVITTAAVAALALAGGSSTGGKEETEGGGGGGGGAGTEEITVAMVTHAAPGDTFWDQVRKGAEDAAKKDNVKLQYTADPNGANQARLVQQAADKGVDGIAVTLAKPQAMKSNVEQAVDADIPVVALNAGMGEWKDMNVLSFFGQDDELAGEAAGERLDEEKAGKTLCVIHEQGHVGLEARCAGAAKKFDKIEKIYVKGTDS